MPSPCRKSRSDCELFVGRRRVHAIHHRLVQAFQFLGGGDVGEHHELLDQPMAVEPRPRRDAAHHAVAVDHHRALRQVEIERAARGAGGEQGAERRIEVRVGRVVARVVRLLHAVVGQARRAAHQAAAETVGRSCGRPRRCAVRRTGSRGPRPAAGCTSRWTAPRAASARRGRGNRRCCRACAPRGRAPSRGGRSARRRRWRRSGGSPLRPVRRYTASSKSRASSPSMVTSGMSRRSVRRPSGVAPRAFRLVAARRREMPAGCRGCG